MPQNAKLYDPRPATWSLIRSACERLPDARVAVRVAGVRALCHHLGWREADGVGVRAGKLEDLHAYLTALHTSADVLVYPGENPRRRESYAWPGPPVLFPEAPARPAPAPAPEVCRLQLVPAPAEAEAPAPAGAEAERPPGRLSRPVLELVVALLAESNERMSGGQIVEAFREARLQFAQNTIQHTLSAAVRRGLLSNGQDGWGGGYGLPEWEGQER